MTDCINKPPHYTSCPSGIECIEIAELLPFCLGNAYKYLHRAGLKGEEMVDIEKARWYVIRAHLNDERLTDKAINRILWVAGYQASNKRELLQNFATQTTYGFYHYLNEYIKQLHHKK